MSTNYPAAIKGHRHYSVLINLTRGIHVKRLFSILFSVILCICLACSGPVVSGLPITDFDLPFSREALLSALYEADIATLRRAIDLKLVSCQELTAYYLERIEAYDKPYNCFITLCDNALAVARERDEALARGENTGLLFGIPIVVKDNIHYEGYYTTNGYDYEDSEFSEYSAYVVERLLEEGAVILAKTNMSLDADSARESTSLIVGETKNAYAPLFVAGGSSGGSAVATSLNFAAASLGTDTNASLRTPAALNGCVALRPTFGLIPTDGIIILNGGRDVPGSITRTVEDQALMLDVLTDGACNYSDNLNANALAGLRLGILEELLNLEHPDTDPSILAVFRNAVEELEACGAEVVTVSMPDLIELSDATFEANDQESKDVLYGVFTDLLAEYDLDAVIYPSCTSEPIRSGYDEDGTFWDPYEVEHLNNSYILPSCAQIPAIMVPIGNHALGSGIGMEIAADKNCEQLLLDIAYSYTQRFDHRLLPSGAPDTYANAHAGDLQTLIDAYLLAQAEATEPPTEAPTVPPTEAPTAAPTTAPTAAPTGEPTTVPTDPAVPPSIVPYVSDADLLTICLAVLAAVMLHLVIHWLRQSRKKGKYSKIKGKYLKKTKSR